jgi:hypothetical protein
MYRQEGEIQPIHKETFPHRFIVFDTEAFRGDILNGTEVQTFKLSVLRFISLSKSLDILEDETSYYTDINSFTASIDQYTRKDKTLYIYAHNIKYDLQLSGLLRYLLELGWKIKSFVFDDPPTFIKITKNRTSIMFVDTFNYWQTSLSKMGEQLGTFKLSMPDNKASDKEWYTYCKRDVDVLTEYILTFMRYLRDKDLSGLRLTLASQAFCTFRHKFMNHRIILHNRKEATQLERDSYSGGRVETYRIGEFPKQNYYKLDVNSMYPYVMKEQLYPFEFVSYSENIPVSMLERLLREYYVIARVTINTDNAAYAYKDTHKLIFPIGKITLTLHQTELDYALARNEITDIHAIAVYNKGDIFSDYVDYFYNLKISSELSGNMVIRHQAKIMMNSLYGKFGQRNIISKITPNISGINYGRITGYSETLGCKVDVNCLGSDMEVINQAGNENTFYCDTDSVIVNVQGLYNLNSYLSNTELGSLKIEDTSDKVIVWGAKDYIFGSDIKHKGIPKTARELSSGLWEYEQFRGAKSWLSEGLNKNVEVYTRKKARISIYDKGIIQPDNSILPVVFR